MIETTGPIAVSDGIYRKTKITNNYTLFYKPFNNINIKIELENNSNIGNYKYKCFLIIQLI